MNGASEETVRFLVPRDSAKKSTALLVKGADSLPGSRLARMLAKQGWPLVLIGYDESALLRLMGEGVIGEHRGAASPWTSTPRESWQVLQPEIDAQQLSIYGAFFIITHADMQRRSRGIDPEARPGWLNFLVADTARLAESLMANTDGGMRWMRTLIVLDGNSAAIETRHLLSLVASHHAALVDTAANCGCRLDWSSVNSPPDGAERAPMADNALDLDGAVTEIETWALAQRRLSDGYYSTKPKLTWETCTSTRRYLRPV